LLVTGATFPPSTIQNESCLHCAGRRSILRHLDHQQ
jgi:hypothetical protein